jgi:biopolymer transport protein TolQ
MSQTEITNQISAAETAPDYSLLSLFFQSDFIIKIVVALLVFYSIWSWAIILDKTLTFKRLKDQSDRFEKIFWSGQLIEQIFEKIKNRADHPMAIIFVSAMHEWNNVTLTSHMKPTVIDNLKERLFNSMEIARNRSISDLSSKIGILATISSSAPFIGLFGTVWGIMDSFRSIAASKNATLAVVAPGIAEALFATALGLIAAIPALIAYNYINNQIGEFENKLDDFQTELGMLFSKELEKSI